MSVFQTAKSAPYYWYDFQTGGRRFHGSTKCTNRKDAEKFEAVERERAKALIRATKRSATSLAIDDVEHVDVEARDRRALHDRQRGAVHAGLDIGKRHDRVGGVRDRWRRERSRESGEKQAAHALRQ